MKHVLRILIATIIAQNTIYAQQPIAKTTQEEIINLEKSFADAI